MPQPGLRWWHLIISTHNSWLPGDARGFRSRKHKIHSSGDYKNPPPLTEHVGLRKYHEERAGDAVVIPDPCREIVARAILGKLRKRGFRSLAIAVAETHAHILAELPANAKEVRLFVGECKTVSSHAIREQVPGRVWAAGGKNIPIDDSDHQRNVYRYILNQKNAWVWDFRNDPAEKHPEAPG